MKITASVSGKPDTCETVECKFDASIWASQHGSIFTGLHIIAASAEELRSMAQLFLAVAAASEKTEEDGA